MNSDIPAAEFSVRASVQAAVVEMEQRMLGFQLKHPSAIEIAARQLRPDAQSFEPPHDRIQAAIIDARDAGRWVSAATIAAELSAHEGLNQLGGLEYLRSICEASPAFVSPEDLSKQML